MFPDHYFERIDESDDADFYETPRLVVHIDDAAIQATTELFHEYLPRNGDILDLMSSWRSHLPPEVPYARVTGLGMNETELRKNGQLSDYAVQNLNMNPQLPFEDASFDACILVVSVQYLVKPVEVFVEVGRVLRPGAPFITVFSNRMSPTKAVATWRSLDDTGHMQLVASYMKAANAFDRIELLDRSPRRMFSDPLYAVVGRKTG